MSEAYERKVHKEIVGVLKKIKFGRPIVITIPCVLPVTHSTEAKGHDDCFEPVKERVALQPRDELIPIRTLSQRTGTICVAEVQMTGRCFKILIHGEYIVHVEEIQKSKDIRSLD